MIGFMANLHHEPTFTKCVFSYSDKTKPADADHMGGFELPSFDAAKGAYLESLVVGVGICKKDIIIGIGEQRR